MALVVEHAMREPQAGIVSTLQRGTHRLKTGHRPERRSIGLLESPHTKKQAQGQAADLPREVSFHFEYHAIVPPQPRADRHGAMKYRRPCEEREQSKQPAERHTHDCLVATIDRVAGGNEG